MATKLQLITAMYDHALNKLTSGVNEWQGFLHSAARNYKEVCCKGWLSNHY